MSRASLRRALRTIDRIGREPRETVEEAEALVVRMRKVADGALRDDAPESGAGEDRG